MENEKLKIEKVMRRDPAFFQFSILNFPFSHRLITISGTA